MLKAICHCGAVELAIERKPRSLTACNCSICRRYGALWAYYAQGVRVLKGRRSLGVYRPKPRGLGFFHCKACACVMYHQRPNNPRMGVNARNLEDASVLAPLRIRMLDGAATWKTLGTSVQPNLFVSPRLQP